MVDLEKKAWKG